MTTDDFIKEFELIANAPNGLQELREMILQLAVRGKLLQQDPSDEPAHGLLEQISEERNRLRSEGTIKKVNELPTIGKNERPYDLPRGWEWVRIGSVINLVNGKAFKPSDWSTIGLPIVRIQNLNNLDAPFNCCDFDVPEKFHINDDDFLISWSGTPGTSFGAFIWQRGHALLNQHIFRCDLFGGHTKEYLRLAINAELDEMISRAHGGVGLRHITKGKLEHMLITLPPLPEQKRIVARVDELMRLCDELEARQKTKTETRLILNASCLNDLTSLRARPPQCAKHFGRIHDNFDLLYDTPKTVAELRKAILQLAVQGRLVPQDPSDEPASVLLEKIATERGRLSEEAGLRRQKLLIAIEKGAEPYNLPRGWQWVRLGNIAWRVEYGTSQKANANKGDVPVMRMGNIREGRLFYEKLKYISATSEELPRLYIENGDLLFNRTNSADLVGKTGIFTQGNDIYTFASYLIRISVVRSAVLPSYVNNAMNAPYYRQTQIEPELTQQCGQANFNGTKLRMSLIPLPPLAEQKRIVAKVDELMKICDELESKLAQSQGDAEILMSAMVHHLCGRKEVAA